MVVGQVAVLGLCLVWLFSCAPCKLPLPSRESGGSGTRWSWQHGRSERRRLESIIVVAIWYRCWARFARLCLTWCGSQWVSPAVWLLSPWGLWVQSSDVFYFCSYDDSVGAYSGLALWAVLALRHT